MSLLIRGDSTPLLFYIIGDLLMEKQKMKKIEKSIDTSNLIYKGSKIDWDKSCEQKLKFKVLYDGAEYEMILSRYNKETHNVYFYHNNKEYYLYSPTFKKARFGRIIDECHYTYNYKVGDIIELQKARLIVNSQIKIKNEKNVNCRGYNVTCLECGYTFDILERHLSWKIGCSACIGKTRLIP